MAKININEIIDIAEIDKLIAKLEQANKEVAALREAEIKNAKALKSSIESLSSASVKHTDQIEITAKETKELETRYKKLNESYSTGAVKIAALKEAQKLANNANKLEAKLLASKEGSYNRLSAQYSLNKLKLNQLSKEERKAGTEGAKLEAQTKDIYEEMKRLQEVTGKTSLNVGNYADAFGSTIPIIGRANAALKAFLANPVVAIVGAIVAVFAGLRAAMQRSEEGQDRLNKAFRVMQAAVDPVLDLVGSLAIALFDILPAAFKRSINFFKAFGLSAELAFAQTRLAWNKLTGDTEEVTALETQIISIKEEFVELRKENVKLGDEIGESFEQLAEDAGNLGKKIEDNIKNGGKLADLEAKRNRAERKVIVENAKLLNKEAELRAFAEEQKKVNADAALEAAKESFDLAEKAAANDVALARLRFSIAQQESALAADDIEAKRKIADANAAIFQAETALFNKKRERERILNSIRLEAFKQENDRAKAQLEIEKLRASVSIGVNKSILASTEEGEIAKAAAARNTRDIVSKLAEERLAIETQALNTQLSLNLISQADYDSKVLLLNERKITALLNAETAYRNELAKLRTEPIDVLPDQEDKKLKLPEGLSDAAEKANRDRKDREADEARSRELINKQVKESTDFLVSEVNRLAAARTQAAEAELLRADNRVLSATAELNAQVALADAGYAANVTDAQRRLDLEKTNQKKALKEKEKAQRAQEAINTASEIANLVTAAAGIWAEFKNPLLAIPAIAVMFGSYAAAKITARKVAGKKKFAKGGLEIVGGGSHASGNDTYMGFNSGGRPAYAERGEAHMIISKGNTRKYGDILPIIEKGLNTGTFDSLLGANVSPSMSLHQNVDMSLVETHLSAIRRNGEKTVSYDGNGNEIHRYKNTITRVINN